MQGQRSLPEAVDLNHRSASSSSSLNQQIFWDTTMSSAESLFSDNRVVDNDPNHTHINTVQQNSHNLVRCAIGESGSSIVQNGVGPDAVKVQRDWSSSLISSSASAFGDSFGEQQCGSKNFLVSHNMNFYSNQFQSGPSLHQISSSSIPQNMSNSSSAVFSKNCFQAMAASSSSHPVALCQKNEIHISENDKPGSSFEGLRLSCKRKAVDANLGQSSAGAVTTFQHNVSNLRGTASALGNGGSSSKLYTPAGSTAVDPPGEVDPNLSIGIGAASEGIGAASENFLSFRNEGTAESTHRNVRLRLNPPQLNFSPSTTAWQFLPLNPSPQLRLAQVAGSPNFQSNTHTVHALTLSQDIEERRLNEVSRTWPDDPSRSLASGVRGAAYQEESGRTNARRLIREPFMSMWSSTEQRSHAQHTAQNPASLNGTGVPMNNGGIMVSTSWAGSSGAHAPPPRSVRTLHSHLQHTHRVFEAGRRSVPSVVNGSGAIGYGQSIPHLDSPATSQAMVASVAGSHNHRHAHVRPSFLLDRQNDTLYLLPYSLQNGSTANEGRRRFASEVRNLLDMVRARDFLRYEDLMLLDQSGIFGSSDLHDRYRDMRLDIDNMSYEELLALEERIGNVSTGLSEDAILKHLKVKKFQLSSRAEVEDAAEEPCSICQEKYKEGDDVGMLECGHGYHSGCIMQWLMHKNLCPICKTMGLDSA